jgi:hypothetical protein
LAADLSSATSPAQAFEAVLVRLAQSVGRLTTLVVGVAIGKIIAGQIDKITQAIDQFQSRLPALRNDLEAVSTATNFDSAISGFKRLNEAADEAIRKAQELRANPFTAAANVVARGLSGTDGIAFLEGQGADLRAAAARNLRVGAGSELRDAQDRLAVAGDKDAEAALARRQKRESEINALIKERAQAQDRINAAEAARPQRGAGRPGLSGVRGDEGDSAQTTADRAVVDELNKVIARRREIADIDDQILAKLKEQARLAENIGARKLGPGNFEGFQEFERQTEAARRALGPELGPGTADAAVGGFRVDAAEFARKQQEEALRQTSLQNTGSFGASSLQRIGFASNEFFDTRNKKDPAEAIQAGNKILQDIKRALESGQPLVLSSNS